MSNSYLRSGLVLLCLLALPVLALSGVSLPKLWTRLTEGRWSSQPTQAKKAPEAPLFEPAPPTSPNPAAPLEQRLPDRQANPMRELPGFALPGTESLGTSVTPASYQAPLASPGVNGTAAADTSRAAFAELEKRLRELGATHFRLETWGAQHDFYRFECKLAVLDNPNCTRHFEAISADPIAAMRQVIGEIEGSRWLQR